MAAELTRLVFVRHGESRSNLEGWLSGIETCGGLTEKGRSQAEALRARLLRTEELRPDVVFTSVMARAIQTAEVVAPAWSGVPVEQLHALSERLPGECEGMNHDEYREAYGRGPYDDFAAAMSPGGETLDEFLGRVRGVVDELALRCAGQTAVLVCHGGVIIGGAAHLAGQDLRPTALRWAPPGHTSITEWLRWDGGSEGAGGSAGTWMLGRYNDAAHLVG